jgi:hypothetical protein
MERVQLRRDSAAAWASNNPILASGEMGIELPVVNTDPVKIKVGNGIHNWNTLPYQPTGSSGGSSGGTWATLAENTFTGTQTAPKVVATFVDKLLTVTPNAGNSNTVTIDTDLNTSFIVDNTSSTGNITVTFAGKAGVTTGNNEMGAVIVRVRQGSTARSITWPTLNAWLTSDGLSPTAPAANKQADFVFSYDTNVNGWVGRKGATS